MRNNNLVDTFGRKHDYLRISLIDKCNLRCTYCMPENATFLQKERLMTTKEILGICSLFVHNFGIKKIRLTGGEPLLRKDFSDIYSGLSKHNIPIHITTNGILLDKYLPILEKAEKKTITISLDTLKAEKFKIVSLRDSFQKVWSNIQLYLNAGFHIKLNIVLLKGFNEDEIIDLIKLGKENNIHLRFIEFMPFAGNKWDNSKVVSMEEIISIAGTQFEFQKIKDKPNSTSKAYQVNGFKGTFSIISTVSHPFCSDCNRIRLTAEGKMRSCLFSNGETDLLTPFRNGEDILPLITQNIHKKKKELGGLPPFTELKNTTGKLSPRSMVKIGG